MNTIVTNFDGLYEEEAEARIYSINERRFCLRHKWVNASLSWESERSPNGSYYSISMPESSGYGGVRFCANCKRISCIHKFADVGYEVQHGAYYSEVEVVGTCECCGRKIKRCGSASCKPSLRACQLIEEVAKELYRQPIYPEDDRPNMNYGSGWVCELPVAVSRIIDESGEQAAKAYVKHCFAVGSVQQAMDMVNK